MFRYAITVSCAVLALAGLPATARAQAGTQAATSGRAAANRTDALAALQDARVTLARLTEASMPQDAREALSRVSSNFRTLYKAYTGEEPTARKSASQAAQSSQPDPNWEKSFDALSTSVDAVAGGRSSARSGAVGTSGTTAGSVARSELTTPVRQDLEVLRQQLDRFGKAAGHQPKP